MFKLLSLCVFICVATTAHSTIVVISDIDDTLKTANSAGSTPGTIINFFKKGVYPLMPGLFQDIKKRAVRDGEDVHFFYVSAAPDFLFNQDKWLRKHKFPRGKAFLRRLGSGPTYEYKMRTIKNILKPFLGQNTKVLFFGDNSSHDPKVYTDTTMNHNLESEIYIRDVDTKATTWGPLLSTHRMSEINYFFSERDLIDNSNLPYSFDWAKNVDKAYTQKKIVPFYTYKTLRKRIADKWNCSYVASCWDKANLTTKKFWDSYFKKHLEY